MTDQVKKNLLTVLISKTLIKFLIQQFIQDIYTQQNLKRVSENLYYSFDYLQWNILAVYYYQIYPLLKFIEDYSLNKIQNNLEENVVESLFIPNRCRSIKLDGFFQRKFFDSWITVEQLNFSFKRKVEGRVFSYQSLNNLIIYFKQLYTKLDIQKFINPIICYYIDDRLFTYDLGKIKYKQVFNNNITKLPLKSIIDQQRNFIDLTWQDQNSKDGFGSIEHLIQKLIHSGDRDYYELSQLIQKQRRLTENKAIDPENVYNHFINGDFQTKELQDNLNLIVMKNKHNFLADIVEKYYENDIFIYNVFRITKNSTTKNLIERQQVQHGMSGELLNYLGYGLEELSEYFLKYGFPNIYNEVTDINVLKGFYQRDEDANNCLIDKKEKYSQKPITFNIFTKQMEQRKITLYPGKTFQVINDKESYDIIRAFKINREELYNQGQESQESSDMQNSSGSGINYFSSSSNIQGSTTTGKGSSDNQISSVSDKSDNQASSDNNQPQFITGSNSRKDSSSTSNDNSQANSDSNDKVSINLKCPKFQNKPSNETSKSFKSIDIAKYIEKQSQDQSTNSQEYESNKSQSRNTLQFIDRKEIKKRLTSIVNNIVSQKDQKTLNFLQTLQQNSMKDFTESQNIYKILNNNPKSINQSDTKDQLLNGIKQIQQDKTFTNLQKDNKHEELAEEKKKIQVKDFTVNNYQQNNINQQKSNNNNCNKFETLEPISERGFNKAKKIFKIERPQTTNKKTRKHKHDRFIMHEDGGFYRWFYFDELSKDINYSTQQKLLLNKFKW